MLIDTHVHVVGADRERFPLRPTGVGRDWWQAGAPDAAAVLADMDRSGVDGAVVVQAVGPYGYDNRYLLEAVAASDRLRAVPGVDLADAGAAGHGPAVQVGALARRPRVSGIRLFGVGPGVTWADDPDLARPRSEIGGRLRAVLSAAADAGVVVVLTLFSQHLRAMAEVLGDFPGLEVALDHCGFPEVAAARLVPRSPLLALRPLTRVVLKVSSHVIETASATGDPARLVAELAALFGPDRLMWGSDYPQSGDDHAALLAQGRAAARDLEPSARRALFGANAARLFFSR